MAGIAKCNTDMKLPNTCKDGSERLAQYRVAKKLHAVKNTISEKCSKVKLEKTKYAYTWN